jgi:hypothetical protein
VLYISIARYGWSYLIATFAISKWFEFQAQKLILTSAIPNEDPETATE